MAEVLSDSMLLYNSKIWMSGSKEDSTWMTFSSVTGLVDRVGREDPPHAVLQAIPESKRIDGAQRRVLPGLHESHLHVATYGQTLDIVDLTGCRSVSELIERVTAYASVNPDKSWIVGRGWEQDLLQRFPSRSDLDSACADRPVVLIRVCGHIGVVNSLALSQAGITRDCADPPGGTIEHYPSDRPTMAGEPSGILLENGLEIIKPFIEPTSEDKMRRIEAALAVLLRNGVTSAHACEEATWNEFCQLADAGRLPIRIFFSGYLIPRTPSNFPRAGETHGPMLSCDRIKLFADGALGPSTAAISHPYCGSCSNHGMLLQSSAELVDLVQEATAAGFRLEIHVIGDRATEQVLDALEAVPVMKEKRPILTHCQILREDLIKRMRSLGVVANIQPQFVPTDARWIQDKLTPELIKYAYAWKTLLDNGIACAGGSDAPVEPPQPLVGIYDAIYRQYGGRQPNSTLVFKPEECLSLTQALDLYTKGGAYATMKEAELGQLQPGYQADFIILDKDVCADPRDLLNAKVQQVWVAGKRQL